MTRTCSVVLAALILASACAPALGADENAPAAPAQTEAKGLGIDQAVMTIGICLAAALAAVGGGYCIARIGTTCIDATARQPEAGGQMFAPMIIAAAMVEGATLAAIVVCLLSVV